MKAPGITFCLFLFAFYTQAQNAVFDAMPTNIGGNAEFKRIFNEQVIYPTKPLKEKVGGKVIFNFVILKDSSVTRVKQITCGNEEIDAEAFRLFRLYQWVPAVKDGVPVNVDWSVTFDFNPAKYHRLCERRGYVKFNYWKEFKIDSAGINPYYNKWEIDSTQKVFYSPDELPSYPKGNAALQRLIKENLEYPKQASLGNIEGTVMVRFVVEPNGLVTNIGIMKPLGGGCDQEAIRVMQMMVKWHPGKKNNNLVRVQMVLPFYFRLNNEFKDNSAGEQN